MEIKIEVKSGCIEITEAPDSVKIIIVNHDADVIDIYQGMDRCQHWEKK